MQHRRQQLRQWAILAITIAVPLTFGVLAMLRLRAPSDMFSALGDGIIVLLSVLVLLLLGLVFLIACLCKRCRRSDGAA